jgi:hypothetical protein
MPNTVPVPVPESPNEYGSDRLRFRLRNPVQTYSSKREVLSRKLSLDLFARKKILENHFDIRDIRIILAVSASVRENTVNMGGASEKFKNQQRSCLGLNLSNHIKKVPYISGATVP